MEVIKDISVLFFLVVALGTGLFSFLVDSKMTGAGFVRLITGVCAGSAALALIVILTKPFDKDLLIYSLLSLTCMGLIYKFHKDDKNLVMLGLWILQNIFLAKLIYEYILVNPASEARLEWSLIFLATSVIYFGIVNYAMILGHYYLVVPKLSEKPLVISMKITWVILLIKLAFSLYVTYQASDFFEENTNLGSGYMFNWIMLSMRYLWGYVAVGILSYFAWRLSKIRSTQSATGVMYVMVFFMIVGEIISLYLYQQFGLYI